MAPPMFPQQTRPTAILEQQVMRKRLDPSTGLNRAYRRAISGAVAAKARYLAVHGEPGVTPRTIERKRCEWLHSEARKMSLAGQISYPNQASPEGHQK
jgi:hypothetical protein